MSEYKGKVVVVTGGAGHIGRAICDAFLAMAAHVVACGRREPDHPIGTGERKAEFFQADLRDAQASVSYTHLRAHETEADLVCRLLLEKTKIH